MPSFKNETAGARTIRKIDGTYVLVEPGQAAFVAQGEIRKVTPGLVEFDDPDGPGEPPAALVERAANLPEVPEGLRQAVAKAGDPFDHDKNGKPGGSPKGARSTRARGAAKRRAKKPGAV